MQESVVCCGRSLYLPEAQRVHGELSVKLVVELLFHCPAGQTTHLSGTVCSPRVGVANPASHSQSDFSSLPVLLPVLLRTVICLMTAALTSKWVPRLQKM